MNDKNGGCFVVPRADLFVGKRSYLSAALLLCYSVVRFMMPVGSEENDHYSLCFLVFMN